MEGGVCVHHEARLRERPAGGKTWNRRSCEMGLDFKMGFRKPQRSVMFVRNCFKLRKSKFGARHRVFGNRCRDEMERFRVIVLPVHSDSYLCTVDLFLFSYQVPGTWYYEKFKLYCRGI